MTKQFTGTMEAVNSHKVRGSGKTQVFSDVESRPWRLGEDI